MNLSRGFTLVELLVVLGVIGILSAALIFAINPVFQIQKGRDTTRKADVNNIRTAFELYRQAEGRYPEYSYMDSDADCGQPLTGPSSSIVYMQELPCDPSGSVYIYSVDDTGVTYTITACLENENDPDVSDQTVSGCQNPYIQKNP